MLPIQTKLVPNEMLQATAEMALFECKHAYVSGIHVDYFNMYKHSQISGLSADYTLIRS